MDDAIVRASREENLESLAEMPRLVGPAYCEKHDQSKVHRKKPMRGWLCNECNNEQRKKWYQKDPRTVMVLSAKARAKKQGLVFNLKKKDIVIPVYCPVLGVPITVGDRFNHDWAPSIDRVRQDGGYTKDNITIISYRANRIKNDATPEELVKVLAYVQQ